MKATNFAKAIIRLLTLLLPIIAVAQPTTIPHRKQPYTVDSAAHDGATELAAKERVAFRQTVQVPDAAWLQLHFGEWSLGEQSYLTITSLKDNHQQRFNGKSLALWGGSSAYFNGNAVEVTLHVAAGEKGIFIRIREVTVGERPAQRRQAVASPESICGTTDDRVASNDPRTGRIVPVGCTGWIAANGAYVTAGHCTGPEMTTLQFNVPASNADGTINNPPPQDQYPIIAGSVNASNGGQGNDWAVFNCNINANTGLLPAQAQSAFFRLSRDSNPATVRITGYGLDGPAPNFGAVGPRNADSQTQQTHAGANLGETVVGASNVRFNYQADSQGGNSGSPIMIEGTTLTIGIHTNAGCTATGGSNSGTGFENDDLETALQTFPGANVQYVDYGHPIGIKDGTIFRPHDTVTNAVTSVLPGGIVSIVTGIYNGPNIITKPLTLMAPFGSVKIGAATAGLTTLPTVETNYLKDASDAIANSTAAKPAEGSKPNGRAASSAERSHLMLGWRFEWRD